MNSEPMASTQSTASQVPSSHVASQENTEKILEDLKNMSPEQIEELIEARKRKIIIAQVKILERMQYEYRFMYELDGICQKCVKVQKIYSKLVMPSTLNMLNSSTASDVNTAVDFVVVCLQLGVEMPGGFKSLLELLASDDAALNSAVVAGFQRIYFDDIQR